MEEFFTREIIFLSCTNRTSHTFFFKFLTSSLFLEEKALVGQGDDISQDGSATREEQEPPVRASHRAAIAGFEFEYNVACLCGNFYLIIQILIPPFYICRPLM